MRHLTTPSFWVSYKKLPRHVRRLADKNYELLKANPRHPSLHFKKVAGRWSVRVGEHHRALGTEVDGGMVWVWIGSHADYDTMLKS